MAGDEIVDESEKKFVRFLCRHLVSLGCEHTPGSSKDPIGRKRFFTSGFVMEFRGRWLYVTAGHVLEDIDQLMASSPDRKYRFMLADAFGPDANYVEPIPFEYASAIKNFQHDGDTGLDFGIILLSENHEDLLKRNGVVPLYESDWENRSDNQYEHYSMLGFPFESMILDEQDHVKLKPIYMPIDRLDAVPEALMGHKVPMFYGRIAGAAESVDIKGMSGCPIFGFYRDQTGNVFYNFLALQSGWLVDSRRIYACLMTHLGGILSAEFEKVVTKMDSSDIESA